MFAQLPPPPTDPILGPVLLFNADPSPEKVDLGIGIYKDERGEATILPSVKAAEQWLIETQVSKRYLSSAGSEAYNRLTGELILGSALANGRSRTVQTPGGTGALRLAAEFLSTQNSAGRIFLPTPTWPNHPAIFGAVNYQIVSYPYYDLASATLLFDEMMAAFAGLRPGDIVLLHGCCHNPAGADPSAEQWQSIADILHRTGAIPLVDLAYQGFGDGIDADAHGLRILAEALPEVMIASSYSKNFALYRERVGALTMVGANAADVESAHGHLMPIARTLWSMPPDHGGAIVAQVLDDATLRQLWEAELATMRNRINGMREALAQELANAGLDRFGFIMQQRGMFVLLGLAPEAVECLRMKHHVHVGAGGRANIAGLTQANIAHVGRSIADVVQHG